MTFEITFDYNDTPFKAVASLNGKDFLVNLVSPVQYEVTPTMVFTIHEDESMGYDANAFEDNGFMPAIETALKNYIHLNKIVIA
ncbi:MAG: hypothetical protein ABIN94_16150 [Ferruginibacter sp.]